MNGRDGEPWWMDQETSFSSSMCRFFSLGCLFLRQEHVFMGKTAETPGQGGDIRMF